MAKVHRQGDATTGHSCSSNSSAPPTVPASYSPNVFINGKAVVREGDSIVPHKCGSSDPHGGVYTGSSSVFVNGKAIQVVGSPISCGDHAAEGSPDVNVGS